MTDVKRMIEKHVAYTDSAVGKRMLEGWEITVRQLVKVMPIDYKRALSIPPPKMEAPARAQGVA
jgi:glutamate synthase domain-containing protein 3